MLKPTWKYNVIKEIAKTLNISKEDATTMVEENDFTDYCYNRNYTAKSSVAIIMKINKKMIERTN